MPVTPLHLGPGAALKAVLGPRMSLSVFAFCQTTMDLEVLARIAVGAHQLHGFTNTLLGATVILVPSVLVGRPAARVFMRWWNSRLSPSQARWILLSAHLVWSFFGFFRFLFFSRVRTNNRFQVYRGTPI